jgi:two-component system sensor histidine kinase HydH
MARVFSDEDIRDIVSSMEHPVVASREGTVVAVNEAWCRQHGFSRAEFEGRPVTTLMIEPDRERLMGRALLPDDRVVFEKPLRTLAKTKAGGVIPVRIHTSRFRAREGPDYRLSLILADPDEPIFGRELLALSAELIGAESVADVQERTSRAFERAGLAARFWRRGALDEHADAAAERALAEHAPVFVGTGSNAEAAYVPLGDDEVLVVAGPSLSGQQTLMLGFVGKLVSTALLDVRASEAARRKLDHTELVLQLARTTSGSLDLDLVMSLTADALVRLLDVSSCFILLCDGTAGVLRGGASSHRRRDVVKDIAIPIDDPNSIAARAARERRMILVPDATHDPLALRSPFVSEFDETALAAVPIVSRDRLEGVVVLDDTRGPRTFSPEWVELASAMVAQVGLSIANARLYDSLRQSYDELAATRAEMVKRERLAGLGELAAIVAHEVRNPLGVIYNATGSLEHIVEGSADGKTLVGIVREECERLNQIVGDLLDFARPRQLSMHPEDVARLTGEVVEALGTTPGVTFDVQVDAALPHVVVDRRLMRQALLNVALNGVQAMPHGGALHFAARLDAEAKEVVLDVRDEGPGIPAADLERVFEPFFTTKATGAGLGLAVVKRIVEEHGGRVDVASSPRGTTFHFRLPLAPGS